MSSSIDKHAREELVDDDGGTTLESGSEGYSDDSDNNGVAVGITLAAFTAKATELSDTMEAHAVSGYGNVINARDALINAFHGSGSDTLTLALLTKVVQGGVKGMPKGARVHDWMERIITTGECSYIEHVKTTKKRARA